MVSKLAVILCLWLAIHASAQAAVDDVDAQLARMSLQQKVGQMLVVTFYGFPPNEAATQLLTTWQPGAVALLPENIGTPTEIATLTNRIQQTLLAAGGFPAFIGVDQEGGVIDHLKDGFTAFPAQSLWTATNDPSLIEQVGQAMAEEMLAVGINMDLAPVADVNTNPNNPIIGRRSFGAFPDQVAMAVSAWIRGAQAAGVLATAKHFPGHGDTSEDSHTMLPTISHDLARLEAVELVPFAASIREEVGAIMAGHLYLPALDPVPNRPASLSYPILTGLLREKMGYEGLIMTDAMDMDAIDTVYSPAERAIAAIEAGNDLILLGAHISPQAQADAMQAVLDAVTAGTLTEARIDASVRRILTAKQRFGLFQWQPVDALTAADRIDLVGHQALVERLFVEGITLAYDNFGALPLREGALLIYPASRPSLWNDCKPAGVTPLGVNQTPTDEQIAWARSEGQRATSIVVFTQNVDGDPQQVKLVQALPPEKTLVVALWDVRDLAAFPQVGAYMVTYSPALESTRALCDILTGNLPVRGVLSLELPR